MELIYIVEDEASIRKAMYYGLKKTFTVKEFNNAEDMLKQFAKTPADIVTLDIGLPGISGLEALEKLKGIDPHLPVIMATSNDEINTAISAMKLGAYDYQLKPVDLDKLKICIKNALAATKMGKDIQSLQQKFLKENMPCFIAESNAIQEVMEVIDSAAKSQATIMILGESGTGKELIANAIHYKSHNFRGPFIAINCASIPDNLIESELFGYEKGAFSGASSAGKKGQIELAADGTLFLDEVGDLSLEAQAKLLRFLQQGDFYRIGGTKKISVTARVISATNKNIEEMIENKTFREDLYYRLAVFQVEIPSLNERKEDILPIARHYIDEISKNYGKTIKKMSKEVEQFLLTHHWQGNIRELKNVIERGVILCKGSQLQIEDLHLRKFKKKAKMQVKTPSGDFSDLPKEGIDLTALEEHYINQALERAKGNDTQAAKLLHMSYYAFRYRKKQLQDPKK